jgi:hypothetical protein
MLLQFGKAWRTGPGPAFRRLVLGSGFWLRTSGVPRKEVVLYMSSNFKVTCEVVAS